MMTKRYAGVALISFSLPILGLPFYAWALTAGLVLFFSSFEK